MAVSYTGSYMGAGWTTEQAQAAREEPTLARPQWERHPESWSYIRRPVHSCTTCLVEWRTEKGIGALPCWSCGQPGDCRDLPSNTGWRNPDVDPTYSGTHEPLRDRTIPYPCTCDDPDIPVLHALVATGTAQQDASTALWAAQDVPVRLRVRIAFLRAFPWLRPPQDAA